MSVHGPSTSGGRRTQLNDIVPGARIGGIGQQPVEIVATRWFGSNALMVTYRDDHGRTGQQILNRDNEVALTIEQDSRSRAFNADGHAWRLAAEALRVRYAALFDPMLAVTTSDLQPLPHQIRAVYGELLPRTPLRFLLADDPGAGKTIMCGLYIKELLLRGDLARCLVVAPGSLVDQWADELYEKFQLRFDILTRDLVNANPNGNPFETHPLLIARMDQVSRNDDLKAYLERTDWDLVVVDEAHRMSAGYFGSELKKTKRYELGELLGKVARHLLLMTATPHSGKQENFQLFMALLDSDRFEGRYRDGVHSVEPKDLMRRMIKEELLTMEGKPLFPDRRAYTVPYDLSHDEAELYDAVTQYVREEMNRAERLAQEGEARRGNTVGFALTVLQRRLASSPEAILRSLERRKARLEKRVRELRGQGDDFSLRERLHRLLGEDLAEFRTHLDDALADLAANEVEDLEEDVVDAATAAQTVHELEREIATLEVLIHVAQRVRRSGEDKKWTELRRILADESITRDAQGLLRKIIVFTEHRDTLSYLVGRVTELLGDDRSVVAIHGGVTREERRVRRERFVSDPDVRVLVATDAAGEGLNLQRAHLMVNYDLPWNPNKIEQRFGRIHRIGQTEVCHLWNLVANNTREGEVFHRLLSKLEEMRRAYGGKVFDVLGDAFENHPLRELLVEAIREGDKPEVRARLDTIVDASVGDGLKHLLAERALHHDTLSGGEVEQLHRRLEEVRAKSLQPYFIETFFKAAFQRVGGRMRERERARYEITHVPQVVRDRDRVIGNGAPVLTKYERVTFERDRIRVTGMPSAQFIAPGHPLLDAVVDLIVESLRNTLRDGAVLVDHNDLGETPRLLVALTEEISNSREPVLTVSKRFNFVEILPSGEAWPAGTAPYLDYSPLPDEDGHLIDPLLSQPWLSRGAEDVAVAWAVEHSLPEHETEVRKRVEAAVAKTRTEVRRRLIAEVNHWDSEYARLRDDEAAGKALRIRPETALRRARALEERLKRREADLDADEHLQVRPPVVSGGALVIPAGLLDRLRGVRTEPETKHTAEARFAMRRATEAVMLAERALGREPEEVPHVRSCYDIRSVDRVGRVYCIKVVERSTTHGDLVVSWTEATAARNLGDDYLLALVEFSTKSPSQDEVRYVRRPFDGTTGDFATTSVRLGWAAAWSKGAPPRWVGAQ